MLAMHGSGREPARGGARGDRARGGHARAGALALALAALGALPGAAAAETYSDEQLGFSLSLPDGYRPIPISGQEQYIVARWQSEREYADKKEGWTHRPEIKVVLFDPKAKKSAEVKTAEGDAEGDAVRRITIKNPYKTYKDWIKSDAEGGRYISKEEETTVHGVPTTWYEVAYEKLTVPRHGLAFVYHAEDIDYCVTTEVLEQHWDKLSPALIRCLKSFKVFPRKGALKPATTGEDDDVVLVKDLSKLTPTERLERRKRLFEKGLKLATERLTEGWFVRRSKAGNYVALSHASPKYTDAILEQAEAVRAWADANLGYFGDGLPGPETIRICKDNDEERAFRDLSSRSGWVQEITLSQNEGAYGLGYLAGAVFDRWLEDKNSRLRGSLPPWLRNGIREYVGSATVKGGRLEFRADGDLVVALKLAAKAKRLIPPQEMMQLSGDEIWERMEKERAEAKPGSDLAWRAGAWQQAAGLVRYLLAGPGRTAARTKDLLRAYITTLDAYVKEQDEKPKAEGESYQAPKTEEEEEERYKNREQFWKDNEKNLLKAVFDLVFKDWSPDDWGALEKSYRSYAD